MFKQLFNRSILLAALLAMLALFAAPAIAQTAVAGAIGGVVYDSSGAVISNAKVVVLNVGTQAQIQMTADSNGYFKAPALAPGIYTVTVQASGFNGFRIENVTVNIGKETTLQPHLSAGAASESVTVSAAVPVLNLQSADFATNLSLKDIDTLPINGRRWSDLALLTPGVTSDANGYGLLSVRGISVLLNNVEIDGADDNQAFFSEERGRTREGYSTSQAAIAEFQVNTGVYSAEYGRAAGGVINSITKSGTNQLHGQAFFYDRDNNWGAMNPLTTNTTYDSASGTYVTAPYKPKDWRKQWGFAAGGPLKTNKLFWFYAYEQYKRNFPGTAKANTPGTFFVSPDSTPAGACNLSTGAYTSASGDSSTNVGACLLAARLGLGSYGAGATLYSTYLQELLTDLGSVTRTGDEVLNTPKIDWQINEKNHASLLYHRLRWDSPGGVQTQATNNYAIDTFGTDFVKLDYAVAALDTMFKPNLSNQLRYQYGRELNWEGQQPNSDYTNTHLVNSTGIAPEVALYPTTGFYMGMPYYSFRTAYPDERKWQVADTAHWTRGAHVFKFGLDIVHNTDLQNNLYEGNGYYNYSASKTGVSSTALNLANYFADLYRPSGACDSGQTGVGTYPCYSSLYQGFGKAKFALATTDYGFFVQDDWKLTPRLTVNLGLRYDYEALPAPYSDLVNTSYTATANHPSDRNNISPRVGFAYDLSGRGKTVLRGGYGIFIGRVFNAMILNTYITTGSSNGQYTSTIYPYSSNAPKFPEIAGSGSISAVPSIDYFSKNMQNPGVQEFDLILQHEVLPQTVVAVSYLGALGRHLPNYLNVNLDQSTMRDVTITVSDANGKGPLENGSTYTVPTYINYANTSFQSIIEVLSNVNSNYNAVVLQAQNSTNKYATFDVTYTFQHALDFAQNQSTAPGSTSGWYDPYSNARANYGNSDFNVPSRLVARAQFNLPAFAGNNGWVKYVANGWSLNPIYQYQNGLPYSAAVSSYNSTRASSGQGLRLAGWNGSGYTTFTPAAGRNTFRRPDTQVFDLRAQKEIAFNDRYHLELIGEGFNMFNHVNVTTVNTTAYSLSGNSTTTGTATFQDGSNGSSAFGSASAKNSNYTYSPRQVQLSIRLKF
jgi:outer membrane receptor protein involved in Fe transport